MATTEIDELQIRIEAEAAKANTAIDTLATKLDTLYNSLGRINGSSITNFANGVNQLALSVKTIASIDGRTFTALTNNMNKLAGIDSASIMSSAYSISSISKAFESLGSITDGTKNIGALASNISRLGGKNVQVAIANLPALAKALKEVMTVLSTSPKVTNNLIKMTNALASLASEGVKIKTATDVMTKGFERTISVSSRASKSTLSLARAFGKFYANYFLLVRGFKGLFKSMQSAMELTETVNYFERTLEDIGKNSLEHWEDNGTQSAKVYAESFAKQLRESTEKLTGFVVDEKGQISQSTFSGLGLNPATTTQYSAMFAQVANSIGMTAQASTDLSEAFVRLGADWASLRNVDFEVAYEKLASGLSGQSRALRAFGVDITMATLQEIAFANGIEKSVSEMTQSEKAYLRLIAIIEQSEVAFGDLAKTLYSPANQMRMLSQGIQNLGTLVGNLFLPLLQRVLPVLNGFVIALQRMVIAISETMGIDTSGFTSIGGMDETFGDLSDSVDEATESAEKFNRATRGWDELNVLGKDTSKGYGVGNDIVENEQLLDAYNDSIEKYRNAWSEAYENINNEAEAFADKIIDAIINWDEDEISEDAEQFGKDIAETLNKFITVENFEKVGNSIAKTIGVVLETALSLEENFDYEELGGALAEVINKILDSAEVDDVASGVSGLSDGIVELISGALKKIKIWDVLTHAYEAGTFPFRIELKYTGNIFTDFFLKELGKEMPDGVNIANLPVAILKFALKTPEKIEELVYDIADGVEYFAKKIFPDSDLDLTPVLDKVYGEVFNSDNTDAYTNSVKLLFEDIQKSISEGDFEGIGEKFSEAISKGLKIPKIAIEERLGNISDLIIEVFELDEKKKKLSSLGENIATEIVDGFKEIKNKFYLAVNEWYNNYVVTWFSDKKWNFSGIGEGLKKAFNTAFEGIKEIWNGFAEWINKALHIDFDGFSKTILGKKFEIPSFDIQLGKLPTFQTGGFPEDGLFMANHSELVGKFSNGKTAVANNAQITQGIEEAAYRGMMRALQSSGVGSKATFEIVGDPNGMFKVMQKQANQYTKSTGRNAFGY